MKILLPTDFSSLSEKALAYSHALAVDMNAEIILLHAFPTPAIQAHIPGDMLTKEIEKSKKIALQRMRLYSKTYKNVTSCIALPCNMKDAIKSAVKEYGADLIAMGTSGASGLLENFLGTKTFSVLKDQEKALLAIPGKSLYRPFKHIVYATDFERSEVEALRQLEYLSDHFKAKISVLHIGKGPKHLSKELGKVYNGTKMAFQRNHRISFEFFDHDNVLEGINNYIEENKAELLVFEFKKHTFIERIFQGDHTRKLLLHSSLPMLVFHD